MNKCLHELSAIPHANQVLDLLKPLVQAFLFTHQNIRVSPRVIAQHMQQSAGEQKKSETVATGAVALASPTLRTPSSNLLSVEEPLSVTAEQFIQFIDRHRNGLNALLKRQPQLLSQAPFSLLLRFPAVLEFPVKEAHFRQRLKKFKLRGGRVRLNISRDNLFNDSYQQLMNKSAQDLRGRLDVHFRGEEGIDAGGLTREFYQKLSTEMMNPNYALFGMSSVGSETYQPMQHSGINPDHLQFFRFCGRMVAKAIFDHELLDCHFTRAFYKQILGIPVSWRDLAAVDESLYKGLLFILENDISPMEGDWVFAEDVTEFGVVKTYDLKENGRDINVTNDNKKEYVRLIANRHLTEAIKEQIEAFQKGFYELIPQEEIKLFDEQDLELIISGLPEVDIEDLRANTEYRSYSSSSPQIQWFWRAVRSFEPEERVKLVQFVTGTGRIPVGGFARLVGMSGPQKFNIHKDSGGAHRLPQAHTCFNQLDLPEYDTYEQLRTSLLLAITEASEGFGFG
eukprot:m.180003 g.180003  ORF g.180003 m.180003 type:complete len:510 (+) comp14651_c3_seq1:981-2510(+)